MRKYYFSRLVIISVPLFSLILMTSVLIAGFYRVPVAHAATIQVTTAADIVANDGLCSLREAITAANTDMSSGSVLGECTAGNGNDVILLPAMTYTLVITGSNEENNDTGDLDIMSHITLQSEGPDKAIIEAGLDSDSGIDRVVHIRGSGTLIGEDLIIRHGNAQGSCPLPIACWDGGGIYNQGVLTLTNSLVTNNVAFRWGGGIFIGGDTVNGLINSVVAENIATDDGGGIFQGDALTLRESMILTNTTNDDGGGIYSANADSLIINDSVIAGNQATDNGGGIYITGGLATVIRMSTIWNNQATRGGGLFNASAPMEIYNSTFSANMASETGGGIHNDSNVAIIDVFNVTFALNAANVGGGLYSRQSGLIMLTNSLVADSLNGGDCAVEPGTTIGDGFFNIIEDGTCLPWAASSDPLLGPLQDNGGETMTHALMGGSPAIDENSDCTNAEFADQRQIIRPKGLGCDIGSYEYVPNSNTEFFVYLPILVK